MLARFCIALGFALLSAGIASLTVSAKGGFAFITIAGTKLKEPLRVTDPALTEDFFAFADFYLEKTQAPGDPGEGYEITRFYKDEGREIAFDHLHYYPEAGFVFYDGIVNGYSEYDGQWYTAKAEMKPVFENVLAGVPILQPQSAEPLEGSRPSTLVEKANPPESRNLSRFITPAIVTLGLAVFVFALSGRRTSPKS